MCKCASAHRKSSKSFARTHIARMSHSLFRTQIAHVLVWAHVCEFFQKCVFKQLNSFIFEKDDLTKSGLMHQYGFNLSTEFIFSKCIIVKCGRLDKSTIQTDLCIIQDCNTLNQDKWKNKNNIINFKKREQSIAHA